MAKQEKKSKIKKVNIDLGRTTAKPSNILKPKTKKGEKVILISNRLN